MKKAIIITIPVLLLSIAIASLFIDDSTLIYPMDIEYYSPAPKDNETSYQVLLNLNNLFSELVKTHDIQSIVTSIINGEQLLEIQDNLINDENLLETIVLIANQFYDQLEKLNQFDSIADNTTSLDSMKLSNVVLDITRIYLFYSKTLVSIGETDKAILMLQTYWQVIMKWYPNIRTQFNMMLTMSLLEQIYDTAETLLSNDQLPEARLTQLTPLLSPSLDYQQQFCRVIFSEYALFASTMRLNFNRKSSSVVMSDINQAMVNVIYLEKYTLNRYGEFLDRLCQLAEKNKLNEMESYQEVFLNELQETHIKNYGGNLLLSTFLLNHHSLAANLKLLDTRRLVLLKKIIEVY